MEGGGQQPRQKGFLAWRRRHAIPPGTPCANCQTILLGPWCHACGQSAHDFHRRASHLIGETFESVFHADGRLWRTLGRLAAQPARLTRDYLDGKRAPQIPPLRLFLVVLLIFFVVGNWASRDMQVLHFNKPTEEEQTAALAQTLDLGLPPAWNGAANAWLHVHLGRALSHPDLLVDAMRERAETFAFLMLPLSASILAALFAFRRGVVLFDHLIFSVHSLSFQGLLFSVVVAGGAIVAGPWNLLLWAAPVHLFAHMRGTYRTGAAGTLLRMAALFVASVLGFAMLLAGLVFVGLGALRG